MDVTFNEHSFFMLILHFREAMKVKCIIMMLVYDVSMFDIPYTKLYCKDKLSCEDHSAGSEPILNMETSPLDNTVSSDPNQLAQSSSHVRLDSLEVPSDPISDKTNVLETNHEIISLDLTLDNTNLDH